MELEKTILMASAGLTIAACAGLLYTTYKVGKIIDRIKIDMTNFLDSYIAYATPRLKTLKDYQSIVELGETRAKTGL